VLMRSAGCAINDFADRNLDGHVARTRQRLIQDLLAQLDNKFDRRETDE